jgi:signal transduction histidine kinase
VPYKRFVLAEITRLSGAYVEQDEHSYRSVVRHNQRWPPGKGFNAEALKRRRPEDRTLGLFSIRQRLAHLGGEDGGRDGRPGGGATVTLPLPSASRVRVDPRIPWLYNLKLDFGFR